jgi:hypothetical protein
MTWRAEVPPQPRDAIAIAALVLTGVLALVVYKTRNQQRHGKGETIRDQVEEDALRLRRQEVLAEVRACSLQEQATAHRSEAVTSRDQLNELRNEADKLTAAAPPPGMPRLVG